MMDDRPPALTRLGNILACPHCSFDKLETADHSLVCHRCGRAYPIREDKVFFCHDGGERPEERPAAANPATWSDWRKANFAFFEERLAVIHDGAFVLDIGIGPGHFRSLMSRFEHVGLDFEPYAGVRVVTDLADRLPFRDSTFDVVVASNVLEHLKRPEEALCECHRVLKPGGLILITVPFLLRVHQAPNDFYRYTHFILHELLVRAHFDRVTVQPLGPSSSVLKTMRDSFYEQLFEHAGGIRKLFVKILYNLSKIIGLFEKRLGRSLPLYDGYTPGYGAVGTA